MPTLLLPPRYTQDTQALWRAAIELGWEVERLHGWRSPEHLQEAEVALYGEPLFAAVVAQGLDVALLEPPFDWLPKLPEVWRRRAVQFMTLAEARAIRDAAFIKPADDKCFAAGVFQSGADLPLADLLPDATPVLVAEPVEWMVEYRCFVLEREVVTLSPYLRDGQLAQDESGRWSASEEERREAEQYAASVLADRQVDLPPAVVVDVGQIKDRGWAIVEANAAWGSGIYGCDPHQVLRVVQRACVARHAVSAAEEKWLIRR